MKREKIKERYTAGRQTDRNVKEFKRICNSKADNP